MSDLNKHLETLFRKNVINYWDEDTKQLCIGARDFRYDYFVVYPESVEKNHVDALIEGSKPYHDYYTEIHNLLKDYFQSKPISWQIINSKKYVFKYIVKEVFNP